MFVFYESTVIFEVGFKGVTATLAITSVFKTDIGPSPITFVAIMPTQIRSLYLKEQGSISKSDIGIEQNNSAT